MHGHGAMVEGDLRNGIIIEQVAIQIRGGAILKLIPIRRLLKQIGLIGILNHRDRVIIKIFCHYAVSFLWNTRQILIIAQKMKECKRFPAKICEIFGNLTLMLCRFE